MYCPNCGAVNEAGAKFCANCGTTLEATGSTPSESIPAQPPPSPVPTPTNNYQTPVYSAQPAVSGNSTLKNIGFGCLIAIVIFLFVGLSCTRACLGGRRSHIIRRF